jgi:tetratricopeptide (TPR) repeat protein
MAGTAAALALGRRAQELSAKALRLGQTEPILGSIQRGFAEDGTLIEPGAGAYSALPEVDALLRKGEQAFGKNQRDEASRYYLKALALEPDNYLALLWMGDNFFADGQLSVSAEWFEKAVKTKPDVETAHRYLADTLVRQNRPGALEQYIEAVVAEPYNKYARHALTRFAERASLQARLLPRFPIEAVSLEGTTMKVVPHPDEPYKTYVDTVFVWRLSSLLEEPERKELIARARSGDSAEDRHQLFMLENARKKRTLAEEVDALRQMTAVRTEDPKWKPRLEVLESLDLEGLLEAFALMDRADDGLSEAYPAYRAEHRAELRRYLRRYWCGLE